MAEELKAFQREDRYIVIKRSDLAKVPANYRKALVEPLGHLQSHLPRRECLVIESDWPEYQPAWQMIEDRVNGSAQLPSQGGEAVEEVAASGISEHSAFRAACVDLGLHSAFESHVMSLSESRRSSDFRIGIDGEYVNSWMRANFAMFCAGRDATTKDSLAVAQADYCDDMVVLLRESLPAVRYEAQRDDLAGEGYRQLVKRIEAKLATLSVNSKGGKP